MKKKINLRQLSKLHLRFRRRQYRVGLISLGILATVILAFNFWFIDHAESVLEQIVETQSNHKLALRIGNFRFNWISNKIRIDSAVFYSKDTTANNLYRVNVSRINFKARGFLPLLFRKQLLIDSIHLYDPEIVFTRINKKEKDTTKTTSTEDFSVAREMGRISQSINDAIEVLQINRFLIDNGSFSLVDQTNPSSTPFVVNRVQIRLDNLHVDSASARHEKSNKILFTDNIAIQTTNQDMIFPGGRHLLSFKNFRFNIKNKLVEFDSCTVRANRGDSSKTTFVIFFDKLRLTNIDFDTLYHAEVIKADSVFCINPKINFDIDSDHKVPKGKKSIQRIDELIQQLFGDIIIDHIIVQNADLDINTIKKNQTNTFSSQNNNFELVGLVIKQDYERPIKIDQLFMSLHNYETYLHDGRYYFAFDSVIFYNNALNLTNFAFREYKNGKPFSSLNMPRFEVRGLSWESLLYDKKFNAESATFLSPIINYTSKEKAKQNRSVFATLSDIGGILQLSNMNIRDGTIRLHLGKGTNLTLENTNLSLSANELTASKKIKNIQHAIGNLHFGKAIFNKGITSAYLNNVRLASDNSILADRLHINNGKQLQATANQIKIGDILLDSVNQDIIMDSLFWKNATVKIYQTTPAKQKKQAANSLSLQNIHGNNTALQMLSGTKKINFYIQKIDVAEFLQKPSAKPVISGLYVSGRDFVMLDENQHVSVKNIIIDDKDNSILRDILFTKKNGADSIYMQIPLVVMVPDISKIINGNITLDNLIISDPVLIAQMGKSDTGNSHQKSNAANVYLQNAVLERPQIQLTLSGNNVNSSYIRWNGIKENSYIHINGLRSTQAVPLQVAHAKIYLTNFEYINAKGKHIATNDNKLNLEFDDIRLQKNDSGKVDWQTRAGIVSMDQLTFDSLGKNNGILKLTGGNVHNIALYSKYINNISDIIKNSNDLLIQGATGSYTGVKNTINWHNLNFANNAFEADSFSLIPLQSIEDYKIKKAFNEDYLNMTTGHLTGGTIDMVKYGSDSILKIGGIQIDKANLFTFKDKTQADTVKKYKLLPTLQIMSIPAKLNIDSVSVKNMEVVYEEINPKTKTLGSIPISNMRMNMYHIKNYDINSTDSLYIYADADVLHELNTRLQVKESYTDSLGSFLMHLHTGPLALNRWNEVLVPLVAAYVKKGDLDSMSLQAVGNNDYSKGTMRMYYHDLSLQLLSKKDLDKQTTINKIVSWIANTFIIRKNNNGKASPVFFERLKDKSAINFLIKTTLAGVKSGVGLPGTKSKERKYFRKAKKD